MANSDKIRAMGMLLQDASLPDLHEDFGFRLDRDYLRGTSSAKFAIRDADEHDRPLHASLLWDVERDLSFARFAGEGLVDNLQFHQVNTFAVLSHTMALVEEELGHDIAWATQGPLVVRPHAFEGQNAYYDPASGSLNFGYFTSPFRGRPVWTCLSHDVLAHELGHAILDAARPLYSHAADADTHALHESFADLLSLFSALEHPALVQRIFAETGGNMRHPSLLSRLAEEFGVGLWGMGAPYLRSALEGPAYDPREPKDAHARSTIWTSAIYDVLEQLVRTANPGGFAGVDAFATALAEAVRWVKGMLFRALHYTPPAALTMPLLARLIDAADAAVYPNDSKFRDLAQAVFTFRNLWDPKIDLTAPDIGSHFEPLERTNGTALAGVVMQHADALGIPWHPTLRLLAPRLITTTRVIDKVTKGNASMVQTVTEHYLEYAFSRIEMALDLKSGAPVAVEVYGGGTLVMDQNWKARLLSTYPERRTGDAGGVVGAQAVWADTRDRFLRRNRDAIQVHLARRDEPRTQMDPAVRPGCPAALVRSGSGAYRITRRICHLHEHVNGIRFGLR